MIIMFEKQTDTVSCCDMDLKLLLTKVIVITDDLKVFYCIFSLVASFILSLFFVYERHIFTKIFLYKLHKVE